MGASLYICHSALYEDILGRFLETVLKMKGKRKPFSKNGILIHAKYACTHMRRCYDNFLRLSDFG